MTRVLLALTVIALTTAILTVTSRRDPTPMVASPILAAGTGLPVSPPRYRTVLPVPAASTTRKTRRRKPTPAHTTAPTLDWDALAACESSGRWHETGVLYAGGLQMDAAFWATYGGLRFAARPDLASKAEQIVVGLAGWRVRGSEPWPTCGWRLGGAR